MAGGDLGTYGTVLRITPLTDGTHDSIRMANPGTTFEAGVIPRCLITACRLDRFADRPSGASNSNVGECAASRIGREANGEAARQWFPELSQGSSNRPVEPGSCIRVLRVVPSTSGSESSDRFFEKPV